MKVIEWVMKKDCMFIVCEFIEGDELLSLPANDIILKEAPCLSLMRKIMIGVSHIHSNGIIHRDLKLENIIIQTNKETNVIEGIKICDLGLACNSEAFFQGICGTYH